VSCPRCGAATTSSAPLDAWRSSFAARDARRLARLALWPPTLAPTRALRRCVKCELDHFVATRACPRCGDETVGLDLAAAIGAAGAAEATLAPLRSAGWNFTVAALAVWTVALVFVARTAYYYGPLRVALSVVYHAAGALLLQTAIVFVARAVRMRGTPPPADATPPPTPGALERVRRELIVPYFDRHGLQARGSVVPALREVDLLTLALAEKGVHVPPERMRPLLVACALLRDLERLERRLAEERERQEGIDLVLAYARSVSPGEDAVALALLAELVADEEGDVDPTALAPRLAAARDELRLRGFVLDLMQRRAQQPPADEA
jgi:hypothetical protein